MVNVNELNKALELNLVWFLIRKNSIIYLSHGKSRQYVDELFDYLLT